MKSSRALCLISLVALAVAGPAARSQANVVENQSTILYVDAKIGSDSNSGSSSAPLKTIQAAVNKANTNNQKSIGTKIIVNAGVYRETVNINPVSGQTSAPLTIEAATNGTAVIAASNLLSGWSTDAQYAGAYVANWTPTQSTCSLPSGWPTVQPIALHTEMLFVNGIAMTQVLTYADLKPGTFFVNTTDGTVHLWPQNGLDAASATVEVATRTKTISVVSRTNVVLRGLVFEHAASCINTSGATVTSSSNVLIDSVQANWNNFGGLGISSSSNVTVQNSIANYNGGVGFQGYKGQSILFANNETDYNNWRGAQATFYDWASGGAKFFDMRTTTVRGHKSYNNQAQGLWFDTDNQNITIDGATLVGSYNAGLQLERNKGPILLENSHFCSSGTGVNVLTTEGLTVNNNVFYNNGATNKYQAQIYLAGTAGGINITDWQTGQVYDLVTTGTSLSDNVFIDAQPGQYVFGTYLSGTDWTDFTSSLKSGNNVWYDPNNSTSFRIPNGKNVDLAGWRTATGADYSSTWSAPTTAPDIACAVPAVSYPDFNVSLDNGSYTMASGRATATVRVNSFNFGAVQLSVSGLPSGVNASFSASSLTNGFSILTLTASSATATQTVPVTLWAVSGDRAHSATFKLTVNANPAVIGTSTSLSANSTSVAENAPVTLTAKVQQASGTTVPTGSITFYNGATSIGTASLSSGTATLTTSSLPVGTDSITASYAGSSTFNASTSSTIEIAVTSAVVNTSTALTASSTSITQNSSITLTAKVQPASGSTAPSGTVMFYNGSTSLGSGTLSGGVASLSTKSLPVGTDAITAVYSGNSSFNSSTSNAVTVTVSSAVVATTTALASSAANINENSSVTLTATVKQSSGTMAPTGTVTFYNGTSSLGAATLSGGIATLTTSALPAGTDAVSAAYSGAVNFNASSSNVVTITVNAATKAVNTSTALTASATSITTGGSVTFTATVKQASGTTLPSGTVTFYNGSSPIGSGALSGGKASITTSALPAGIASVMAAYAGNVSFNSSSSAPVVLTVTTAPVSTSTTLSASSSNIKQGQKVTFTAHVTSASASSAPGGSVTFYAGVTAIGTGAISSGTTSFTTSALPQGSQTITARYGGDALHLASTSNAVKIEVANSSSNAMSTRTAVSSSSVQADQGYTISLSASVVPVNGSGIPTGSVEFSAGSKILGSANLTNGKAYFNTAALPTGYDRVTATYVGDTSFAPSTSAAIWVKISGPDFTVAATPSSVSIQPGQSANVSLLITPSNGFNQIPELSCSGLPTGVTCSFGAPVRQANGTSIVAMTIRMPKTTAGLNAVGGSLSLALLPVLFCFSRKRREQFRRLLLVVPIAAVLMFIGGSSIGCGGRAPMSGTKSTSPDGTVSITVVAKTSTGISHSTVVDLKVM